MLWRLNQSRLARFLWIQFLAGRPNFKWQPLLNFESEWVISEQNFTKTLTISTLHWTRLSQSPCHQQVAPIAPSVPFCRRFDLLSISSLVSFSSLHSVESKRPFPLFQVGCGSNRSVGWWCRCSNVLPLWFWILLALCPLIFLCIFMGSATNHNEKHAWSKLVAYF